MSTKKQDKSKIPTKSPRSPRSPRRCRSVSPNNVVINGQVIDRDFSDNIVLPTNDSSIKKHNLLDNIMEESDITAQENHSSQENLSTPLEDAVKIADENVQRFIQEIYSKSSIQESLIDFKSVCTKSQEELKGLSNFLSTIDDESKNKIVDTLISVYKKEILSSVDKNDNEIDLNIKPKQESEEPENKIAKFKNVCKGIISEYKKRPISEATFKEYSLCDVDLRNMDIEISNMVKNNELPETEGRNFKNVFETHLDPEDSEDITYSFIENDNIRMPDLDQIKNNFRPENRKNQGGTSNYDYSKIDQCLSYEEDKPLKKNEAEKGLNLTGDIVVNYHTKSNLLDDSNLYNLNKKSSDSNLQNRTKLSLLPSGMLEPIFNPFTKDVFRKKEEMFSQEDPFKQSRTRSLKANRNGETMDDLPIKICPSKEEAIKRILGKQKKENVSEKSVAFTKGKHSSTLGCPPKSRPMKGSAEFYDYIKKSIEEPQLVYKKRFRSEGVQVYNGLDRTKKHNEIASKKHIDIIRPYKYHPESFWESKSDIAIECPLGCQLRGRKSKSDTNLNKAKPYKRLQKPENIESKKRSKLTKNEKKLKNASYIKLDKKPSIQLLEAQNIIRQKQKIRFLEDNLKRGDSEYQFSQILFETAAKNIDNDASTLIIPTLDEKQVDNFNANYLLHAIKIQRKSDILPSSNNISIHYYNRSVSNPSITEEDYKTWLKKQNWAKYSNLINEIQSLENLQSISQTIPQPQSREAFGEIGFYLDRGDMGAQPSTLEQVSTLLSSFSELFLYEHVVISKAINFCSSLNVQRTKTFTCMDRLIQIMFFVTFYLIWLYLDNYIFVEQKSKGGRMLWP